MRAYFVIGPESSGTRMMTQAFLSLGAYGDGGHKQRLDREGFKAGHEMIVFRRSVPHGKNDQPKIAKQIHKMETAGYKVVPVVIVRDKDMCAASQVRRRHVEDDAEARSNIHAAIDHIFVQMAEAGCLPHVVFYEPFVRYPGVRAAFFASLSLGVPHMDFYDGDEKHKS